MEFVSTCVEKSLGLLASPIVNEFKKLWGVEADLKRLGSLLSGIHAVLEDADRKQVDSLPVKEWLRKLKNAAYDAEDALEEFAAEALRSKMEANEIQRSPSNFLALLMKVRNFFLSCFRSNPIVFRHDIAHQIERVREKLDAIAKEQSTLQLQVLRVDRQPEIRERPPSISMLEEPDVFGREDDEKQLMDLLASDGSRTSDVSFIPIVGMGGLGKTTLAQCVYNAERVQKLFNVRGWVCVSQNFDMVKVVNDIIESIGQPRSESKQLDALVIQLQAILSGKKYLLVLDDVWSEDRNIWNRLRVCFTSGAKGSKIIITTRIENICKAIGGIPPYRLGTLSEGDCLKLFKKRAFGNESWDENLASIGVKIVRKCKGLPLAAKTLGGLLQDTRDAKAWMSILESEIWRLKQGDNDVLPALRLSYDHLPSTLKQCFAFCSIFPQDYEFEKEDLVKLWMGAGFIRPEAKKEPEDIGGEYFDRLVWRSFFQYERVSYANNKLYKMHDLIHDLAQSVSQGDCLRVEGETKCHSSQDTRYLSLFLAKNDQRIPETLYECRKVRTLLYLSVNQYYEDPVKLNLDYIFGKQRFIRVLDLSRTSLTWLPDSIENLKHLRYLNISGTPIKSLPESVCRLYNLETLLLITCIHLRELPKDMRHLIKLRHLTNENCHSEHMPHGIGTLTSLQTLSNFIVGKESGNGIGELKELNNLRGLLTISKLQNAINAKDAEIHEKRFIQKLSLEWNDEEGVTRNPRVEEETLTSLKPCTILTNLTIVGYMGEIFPCWVGHPSFSKLEVVEINDCASCKILLPPLGQLPHLKKLKISFMDNLKEIGGEFCGREDSRIITSVAFPSLEKLVFSSMRNLKKWCGVKEEGDFPRLNKLKIDDCPSLTELPRLSLPRLQSLKCWDCNENVLKSFSNLTSLTEVFMDESLHALLPIDILPDTCRVYFR